MVAMSEETEKLGTKREAIKDKLNIAIFKLIGQKLHVFGTKPTKDQQINSNKIDLCYPYILGLFIHSVSMLRALYLYPLK